MTASVEKVKEHFTHHISKLAEPICISIHTQKKIRHNSLLSFQITLTKYFERSHYQDQTLLFSGIMRIGIQQRKMDI